MSIKSDTTDLAVEIKRLVAEFSHKHGARCSIDVEWIDSTNSSSKNAEYIPIVSVSAIIDSELA